MYHFLQTFARYKSEGIKVKNIREQKTRMKKLTPKHEYSKAPVYPDNIPVISQPVISGKRP